MGEEQDVELLKEIYHDARMGADSIHMMMDKVDNYALKKELDSEMGQYNTFADQAEEKLHGKGKEPEKTGLLEKAGVYAGMQLNRLIDADSDHLAEMVINGSTMGVVEMTKSVKKYQNVPPDVKSLADRLIGFQQGTIETMKAFL